MAIVLGWCLGVLGASCRYPDDCWGCLGQSAPCTTPQQKGCKWTGTMNCGALRPCLCCVALQQCPSVQGTAHFRFVGLQSYKNLKQHAQGWCSRVLTSGSQKDFESDFAVAPPPQPQELQGVEHPLANLPRCKSYPPPPALVTPPLPLGGVSL